MDNAKTPIHERLDKPERSTLERLADHYGTLEETVEAVLEESGRIDEAIHEIADGEVSVYTADQMQWLAENIGRADQEEAVACGATTAQEIATYCWYRAEYEDLQEAVGDLRDALQELKDEEDEEDEDEDED